MIRRAGALALAFLLILAVGVLAVHAHEADGGEACPSCVVAQRVLVGVLAMVAVAAGLGAQSGRLGPPINRAPARARAARPRRPRGPPQRLSV